MLHKNKDKFSRNAYDEWVFGSGVDEKIYYRNVEIFPEIDLGAGSDPSFPIDEFLNRKTIRFSREAKNRDGFAWICRGLDPLNGWGRMDWGCAKLSRPYFDQTKGKARKYEHPSGMPTRAFFLDVPRHIWEAIAARFDIPMPEDPQISFWQWVQENPEIPIIITEGAKKAAALLTAGYAAIALPGIWNARRVLKSENGVTLSESLIPDLKPFLNKRSFYFCFDHETNPKTAKQVNLAQIKTGKLLLKEKCSVFICTLPAQQNGKTGIDDFLVSGGNFDQIFENAPSLNQWQWDYQQSKKLKIQPWIALNTPDLSTINLKLPESGLIAIASGKGTGKSKLIAQAIVNDEKVVSLGHRVCLMRSLCERWGLDYRGDLDKFNGEFVTGSGYSSRVGACIDSALSFRPDTFKDCTLIIDEAVQVVRHLLTSATCKKDGKRPAILARFEQLIRVAERVVIADADLDDKTIKYFKKLRGDENWPIHLIKNDYKLPGYSVDFYISIDDSSVISRILADAFNGEKLFISTDAKAKAEAITELLQKLNLKVLLISSDTSGDEIQQAFIKDPNHRLSDFDCVVSTPSLATGVSIEEKYFTKVYGLYSGVITDADIAQSLMRVRDSIPRVVWVSEIGNEFSRVSKNTFPLPIKNALKKAWEFEMSLIRASLQPDTAQFLARPYNWEENPHLNLWADISADHNQCMWSYRENALARLKSEGHRINLIHENSDKNTQQKMKKAKGEISLAKCEAIANAAEISAEERAVLEKKEAKTKEEKEALAKAAIADFYAVGFSEVTPQLVQFDDEGRKRTQILKLELLLSDRSEAIKRDVKAIEKQANWDKEIWIPDLSKFALETAIREGLGLKNYLDPDKEFSSENLEEFAKIARKYSKQIENVLGFKIPKNQSALWIFRQFLDQLGIGAVSKRIGKQKKTICSISKSDWEKAQDILTRRAHRKNGTENSQPFSQKAFRVDNPPCNLLIKTGGSSTPEIEGETSLNPLSQSTEKVDDPPCNVLNKTGGSSTPESEAGRDVQPPSATLGTKGNSPNFKVGDVLRKVGDSIRYIVVGTSFSGCPIIQREDQQGESEKKFTVFSCCEFLPG